MKSLRLLKLQYLHIKGDVKFLPNSLRYLDWGEFPSTSLPTKFQPDKLLELHLCYSSIKLLWKEIKPLKMLKVINLRHSKMLTKTPSFREVPKLEKLILEGCTRLSEIHHSIGLLKELVLLNLKGCKNLKTLPSSIGDVKSLKVLNLSSCTELLEIHDSIGGLKELVKLKLKDCNNLKTLPSSISDVKSLKVLNLSGCSSLGTLPESLGELTSLQTLNLARRTDRKEHSLTKPWNFLFPWKSTNFTLLTLPSSISNLCSLRELDLSYCHLKGGLPDDLSCFPLLETLNLSGNDFVSVPTSINQLSKLVELLVADCTKLESMSEFPSTVEILDMNGCISVKTFPSPFENYRGRKLSIHAADCFKLTKNQQQTNMVLEWLESCFRFWITMKHNGQEISDSPFEFFISIPGSAIPKWFNLQSPNSSVTAYLPPNWCNDQWMGFAICGVWCFETHSRELLSAYNRWIMQINIKYDGVPYEGSAVPIRKELQIATDHVWLVFRRPYKSLDWLNKVSKIEIEIASYGVKIKSLGFRIVYKQDIEELLQCYNPSKRQKFLTIHEENCDDGGQESN